jgi:signal transduction histidine kinase
VYTAQATRRAMLALNDRIDAALCYVELARAADETELPEVLAHLGDALRGLSAAGLVDAREPGTGLNQAREVHVRALCIDALDNVASAPGIEMTLAVEPPDLTAFLLPDAVGLALEELLQNAVSHAGASRLSLTARAEDRGVVFEVKDDGAGWDVGVHQVEDVRRSGEGVGLALCELVASLHDGEIHLFRPAEGGAGVRLELAGARGTRVEDHENLRLGS